MDKEFNLANLGDWNKDEISDKIFNDAPEVFDDTSAEDVLEKIKEEDDKDLESNKDKQDIEIDWDEDNPNFGAEDVETPSKPVKKDSDNPTISATQLLIDKGIIDYELDVDEELDEATALELLEEGFETGVENRIKDLLQELPKELQALNKYVLSGGGMEDYFAKMTTIGKTSEISPTLDITKEDNQELVLRHMYKDDGMDDDFIEMQIDALRDTGKLESFAKKKFEKWKEQDSKNSQKAIQEQETIAKEQRNRARRYYFDLKNIVDKEDFDGIKLSIKDKLELPTYMTNRNIQLNNGSKITPFNQDLMDVLQNQKASVQLAKLIKGRKEDGTFDFSFIEKTATTKVAQEMKKNIRRSKEMPKKSTSVITQSRSLADYFN